MIGGEVKRLFPEIQRDLDRLLKNNGYWQHTLHAMVNQDLRELESIAIGKIGQRHI